MNRNENSTYPSASAMGTDPVLALAIRWNASRRREDELDQKELPPACSGGVYYASYYRRAVMHAGDETEALRSAITFTEASSLVGAGVQIIEALNILDAMPGDFPDARVEARIDAKCRILTRLLYSVIRVVDAHSAIKLEDVVDELLSPQLNPWTPVEDRITALEAK